MFPTGMLATCKTLTIAIDQLKRSRVDENAPQSWEVQISVTEGRNEIRRFSLLISDPFSQEDHDNNSHYLNDLLRSRKWLEDETQRAECASDSIKRYSNELLGSLKLDKYIEKGKLAGKRVNLEVCTKSGFVSKSTSNSRSIQCLHWELLEHTQLWSYALGCTLSPCCITVRRRIEKSRRRPGEGYVDLQISPIRERSFSLENGRLESFNVLLVVARRCAEVDAWSPTTIQAAVLKMREELLFRGARQRINVQVVRPGSLAELDATLTAQPNHFRVVHFDMHGGIFREDYSAFLQFNKDENNRLAEDDIKGKDIADLVLRHGIRCVVLGACKSAHADAQAHANLSWIFVEKGISNVLAMSFNMADTMSEKFFNKFYYELFIGHQEFSEAARLARQYLFQDPQRWHYSSREWKNIVDWFVPVVYSSGRQFYIDPSKQLRRQWLLTTWDYLMKWFLLALYYSAAFRVMPVLHWLCEALSLTYIRIAKASYFVPPILIFLATEWKRHQKRRTIMKGLEEIMEDRRNILRVENDLRRAKMIFFHSDPHLPRGRGAQHLLNNLLLLWQRTGLVDQVVKLDAASFQTKFAGTRRAASRRIDNRTPRDDVPSHDQAPRMMVVIENIHVLYPEKAFPEDIAAQATLEQWIDKHFGLAHATTPPSARTHAGSRVGEPTEVQANQPYLVIVGHGIPGRVLRRQYSEATAQWFKETLGKVAALKGTMAVTGFAENSPNYHIQEAPHYPLRLKHLSGQMTGA